MKKISCIFLATIIFISIFTPTVSAFINTHTNTGDLKTDIVAIAKTQLGYCETDNQSKYDNAVSGTFSNSSAAFLGWCANEASAPEEVIPRIADVEKLYEYYQEQVKIHNPDEHLPAEGDIIFISKNGKPEFCGLVLSSDSEYITAIIGDDDGYVRKKMYSVTLSKIYAYATPDYNLSAMHSPGRYMTTASALNFRENPTTSSTSFCKIPLGTVVTITSISGDWGCLEYDGKTGWVHLDYVVPFDDSHTDTSEYAVKWNVIDVSKWQGDIDWNKIAAADIEGVILRIAFRGTATKVIHTDERFYEYYKGAKEAGLHIGCYFYSAATTVDEAKEEARYVINEIRKNDLRFDMPVYIDMEDKVVQQTGKTLIFNMTKAFFDMMDDENIYSGVYCSTKWAEDYYIPALFTNNALWIADWRDKCQYSGEYGMWQYTEYG
ncbi:MAG: SH3 domain-containing protein, partial [Clostridia bacterium]|nr:SH3 domain-containing protein [Clostridia bacterium]